MKVQLCDLALKVANTFNVKLDFTHESIKDVEKILGEFHKEYLHTQDDKSLRGIAVEFAAYIICVIEKNEEKGKWEKGQDQRFPFPYHWKGLTLFPYSWCIKRIFNGKSDNVWTKYKLFVIDKLQNKHHMGKTVKKTKGKRRR